MICNQCLKWEIRSGELYIHFCPPVGCCGPLASEVGPLYIKYKNVSCYTLSGGYLCKFGRNKFETKEFNIIWRHLKCNVISIKKSNSSETTPVKINFSRIQNQLTPQIAHNTEIRRWLKLTHKVCRTMTKKQLCKSFCVVKLINSPFNCQIIYCTEGQYAIISVPWRLLASPLRR